MTLPETASQNDVRRDFIGFEGEVPILFRWFPVEHLAEVPLYPTFLRTALSELPEHPVHLIHHDPTGS